MNKIYCCADLHGNYQVWKAIQSRLDETDKLYFLGDACDRGPDGWKIIEEMLADPRVEYLKGNHEDMLADAMEGDDWGTIHNGGQATIQSWAQETNYNRSWANRLRNLPDHKGININGRCFWLSHAGEDPTEEFPDYIWDRDHFYHSWPTDPNYDNIYVVHGHTPLPLMLQRLGIDPSKAPAAAYHYCNGHKINIDLGGFFTNLYCLLDLSTLEETIFNAEGEALSD